VNIKGPDSHQCSLVGRPGTIEGGAPLAWHVRDPFSPVRIKDSRPREAKIIHNKVAKAAKANHCRSLVETVLSSWPLCPCCEINRCRLLQTLNQIPFEVCG
jgi:hypothetical protein